ncbi:MAG: hypothetical protein ACPH5S_05230, partial [Candidatus Poseidoniaceae archaeon]
MEGPQEDDLLRERAFQRAGGLDLSGFALNVEEDTKPLEDLEEQADAPDAAVGDIHSPFGTPPSLEGPADDVVTGLAVEGERRRVHLPTAPVLATARGASFVIALGIVLAAKWFPRRLGA